MPLTYCRKNGKPFLSTLHYLEHELGIPRDELEAIAAKYRPQLESWGVLDDMPELQRMWLLVMMWKCSKEKASE